MAKHKKLLMWQNSECVKKKKTNNLTNQKHKVWQNKKKNKNLNVKKLKTQNVIYLDNSKCDKTKKTQNVTKLEKINILQISKI